VLSRAKVTMTHDVVVERLTITDRILELADRLATEGSFTFESCFAFVAEGGTVQNIRHAVVVTFLAVLEMTRLKLVRLTQPDELGPIYVTRAVDDVRDQAAALGKERGEEYR
jgi:segregation and condensation protein A